MVVKSTYLILAIFFEVALDIPSEIITFFPNLRLTQLLTYSSLKIKEADGFPKVNRS